MDRIPFLRRSRIFFRYNRKTRKISHHVRCDRKRRSVLYLEIVFSKMLFTHRRTHVLTYLYIIVHFSYQHARTVYYYIVFIKYGRVRHVPRRIPTLITMNKRNAIKQPRRGEKNHKKTRSNRSIRKNCVKK